MFDNLNKKTQNVTKKIKTGASSVKSTIIDNVLPINENINDAIRSVKVITTESLDSFSDKYIDSHLDKIESYCSWCFERSTCILKEKNNLSRNIYICSNCGNTVVKCLACNNKAKYSNINDDNYFEKFWSNKLCAVHEGRIAKFETLNWSLNSIGEYRDIIERNEKNYKKIATITAVAIGGLVLIAPAAFLAAPTVGGAIGSSLYGLSGAAATNSGLALLGGGAIAAGGTGVSGGIAVLTATGSALGGRMGAVIANSYFGDIDGFDIIRIKSGQEPSIICIDGFLTEEDKKSQDVWIESLSKLYPNNTIYYVKWESKRLHELAKNFCYIGGSLLVRKKAINIALSASKEAAKKLTPIGRIFSVFELLKNPWSIASLKAYETGALLADIIARTDKQYILIGHSLGARVIYACLASLKTKDSCFIQDVHLLGGAVNNQCIENSDHAKGVNWDKLDQVVSGKIYNYYSKKDSVLKLLYKAVESLRFDFGNPIGRNKILNSRIINIDVSSYISGHTEYKSNLSKILVRGMA